MGAYDDIIGLPRPVSARRPRMPMADRAAQFSPFAALVGHGDAIRETARLTDQKIELTEEEKTVLDKKLCLLLGAGGEAVFTYFLPDGRKDGGAYVTAAGRVKKLDLLERRITLNGGAVIPVDDIIEIECAPGTEEPPWEAVQLDRTAEGAENAGTGKMSAAQY